MRPSAFLAALSVLVGCVTTEPYVAPGLDPVPALPTGRVAHRVFLAGNTGSLGADRSAVLAALSADAQAAGDDATVVVLGDVTEAGIPAADDAGRAEAEAPVRTLVAALDGLAASVVVVPGDRDWAEGEDGLKRLEEILDEGLDADVLTPGDQSGGPREDKLAEGLRLIALDTAWWLLDADDRPSGEAEDQDVIVPGDVARVFEQVVRDRDDDRIVVVAHHPLLSRGPRAGYRADPVSGLVGRTLGLGRQDLAAPGYRALRETLGRIARVHDRLVWASAHEGVLSAEVDYVNSLTEQVHVSAGTAGGEADPFRGAGALYASARPGYQRLVYYADGRLWLETVELDEAGAPSVALRYEVAGPLAELLDPEVPEFDPADLPAEIGGTVTQAADADFESDRFQNDAVTRAVLGERYRDVWRTPATFEVLDLGAAGGGLTPIKRGGGKQTTGLRLQGADGHEYNVRLLEKSGTSQVPVELRDGLVGDVVLELRAAMNPYASLAAASLADAAGVTQPSPRIVYVPDDPRLGRYRETFAGRLALFEVRPDDDMSDVPGFEGMDDVVSIASLREDLREDQDHRVDQRAFLRARLFDMLIADWDRHYDQWRWAAFEPGELDPSLEGDEARRGKVYRPIARDRDFSFYGIGGLLRPVLQAFDNRLQPISEEYGSIDGLTHNGFDQDRRFLNELTLDDWLATAEDVQARVTDAAIDRAIDAVPPSVRPLVADDWREFLRARRDLLVEAAETYYRDFQAPVVDVLGSDERELFEADRQPDGSLALVVRSFKGGEPGAVLYRRTFRADETDEVRVFALGGRDVVRVTGAREGISVRVVGGAGEDVVEAPAGRVDVYDTPDGLEIAPGSRVADRRSTDPGVNRYDETERVLGDHGYRPVLGYRATDGAVLGVTSIWTVPGFRLRPFAAQHVLSVNVATQTGGLAGSYDATLLEAIGQTDLDVRVEATTPRYARNFYGLGNGSPDLDADFARVDLARVQARVGALVPLGQRLRLVAGPSARYADASRDDLLGPTVPVSQLPDRAFEGQLHAGAFARVEAATLDAVANPRQGLRLALTADGLAGVTGPADTYGRLGAEAVAYVPVRIAPQLTLAARAGAETTVGDFPFFDGAVLGGPGTVRGYRRERFTGRSAASAGAELRAKLLTFDAYVLPIDVGALGFVDAGRVWAGDSPFRRATFDRSDEVQLGYGGGLWFGVLDRGVVNVTAGISDEATLVTVGLGFAY